MSGDYLSGLLARRQCLREMWRDRHRIYSAVGPNLKQQEKRWLELKQRGIPT
jgi:hypothetical protein